MQGKKQYIPPKKSPFAWARRWLTTTFVFWYAAFRNGARPGSAKHERALGGPSARAICSVNVTWLSGKMTIRW